MLAPKTVAERFHYDSSDAELNEIVDRVNGLSREADSVRIVFNNHPRDFAPVAAERLRRELGQNPKTGGVEAKAGRAVLRPGR